MRYLTSFIAISILAAGMADAAPSRARPGSVSGVLTSKMAPIAAPTASMSSLRYSPLTNNPLKEVVMQNGGLTYVDTATDDIFIYDQDGNMIKQPVDPDNQIVTALGVSVGTARRACMGIYADGHQGVFDETTYECLIPVVAHNWSGIIKKDGEEVIAWAPMGNMLKCSADAFEQVQHLRRTSQWVIPVMVVGSAGIGAGIGAAIDSKQAKKDKERADALKAKVDEMSASMSQQIPLVGDLPITVQYRGRTFELRKRNAGDTSCPECDRNAPGRDELLDLLKKDMGATGGGTATMPDFQQYANNILACLKQNFREMVATNVCGGQLKLGRVKITRTADGCKANGFSDKNDRLYCWYDAEHAQTNPQGALKQFADCYTDKSKSGREEKPFGRFFGEGKCYFRDEITAYRNDASLYNRWGGTNTFAREYDTTAGSDLHRWNVIEGFADLCANRTNPQSPYAAVLNGEFKAVCDWAALVKDNFRAEPNFGGYGANVQGNYLDGFMVFSTNGMPFSGVAADNCGQCKGVNGGIPSLSNETVERLREQYGALSALRQYAANMNVTGPNLDLSLLEKMLSTASAHYDFAITMNAEIGSLNEDIDEIFGQDQKKGFFQKNVGKGMLIGAGVGALAGLGYWFAEGASVFCNVGGLDQVKLNKTFAIPSFRDYIYQKGYFK